MTVDHERTDFRDAGTPVGRFRRARGTAPAGGRRPARRQPAAERRRTTSWRPTTSRSAARRSRRPSRRSAITPPAGSRTRPRARCSSNARRGRPASIAFDATGRIGLLARRLSAQDDAAPRRARDVVRPAAHGRRRGHLRHVREPGRAADLAARSPTTCCATFPGPAYGPIGIRKQDRLRARSARLRHDPQADGRDHARRRRAAGRARSPAARS